MAQDKKPPQHNEIQAYNLGWYQLFLNLYLGQRYVFMPPEGTIHPVSGQGITSYLEKLDQETWVEFRERINQSFYLPYVREVVQIVVSTVFKQTVSRAHIEQQLGAGGRHILDNVDLKGTSAHEFVKRAFTAAQVFGWAPVLTDYPQNSDGYLSAYHEAHAGNRPYCKLLSPLNVLDWQEDTATGALTYFEYSFGEYVRRWYPDHWVDVDGDGEMLRGGAHSYGGVPVDILVSQDILSPDMQAPFGGSLFGAGASLMLHAYQTCSLLEAHQRKALFTFLRIARDPDTFKSGAAPDLQLGQSHYIFSDSDVGWVEPPASVPREAREHLSWLVREFRNSALIGTRSEESTEAHSGASLQWEYSTRHNSISELASKAEKFDSQLWVTIGRWLGVDVEPGSIKYAKDYATTSIDQELSETERIVKIANETGTGDNLRKYVAVKLARIAAQDVGHIKEGREAIDEIRELMAEPEDNDSGVASNEAVDPTTALNGAQVTALLTVIKAVAEGQLPRSSAVEIIASSFPVDYAAADRMLGEVGRTFVVEVPADQPVGQPVEQPVEQPEIETEPDESV